MVSQGLSYVMLVLMIQNVAGFHDSLHYSGSEYQLSDMRSIESTYSEKLCESRRGFLVEIENAEEYSAIKEWLATLDLGDETGVLIGGTDVVNENTFVFQFSGRNVPFFNWESHMPDHSGDCLQLSKGSNYQYDDIRCDKGDIRFLCEIPEFQDSVIYGGSRYELSKSRSLNKKSSEAICKSRGGYLAKIETDGEYIVITGWLDSRDLGDESGALIGGTDAVNENSLQFQFSLGLLPSIDLGLYQNDNRDDCVLLVKKSDHQWDDIPCDRDDVRFVCEIPGVDVMREDQLLALP